MADKLAVVMPVYNEEAAIGAVVDKWVAALDALHIDYTINPYNDGSKDSSWLVIQQKAAEYPGKVIAHNKTNGGHGPTILQGYREAVAAGGDWIFQIDSDDEMGPEGFAELWNKRADYDFLIGIRDGRKQALPRKIISAVSRLSVWLFYGRSVWDVNAPYRLMRVSAFGELYQQIPSDTFAPNLIISGMAARNSLRCYETRVPQKDRQTGEVSIKKWKLLKGAAKSFAQTSLFAIEKVPRFLLLMLAFIFLFVAIGHSPLLSSSHPTDHWVFLLSGKLQAAGGSIYTEFFDHKGPVLHWLYGLGYLLSKNFWGIWGIEFLGFGAIVLTCFLFLCRKVNALFAFLASTLLICLNDMPLYPEAFAYEMSLLGIVLILRYPRRMAAWFGLGVLGIGVFFIKQTCIGLFVAAGMYLLLGIRSREERKLLYAYLWGGGVSFAAVISVLAFRHILISYFDCCILFNLEYARNAQFPLIVNLCNLIQLEFTTICMSVLAFILILGYGYGKRSGKLLFCMGLYILWDIFFIAKTGRLAAYQFPDMRLALVMPILYFLYCIWPEMAGKQLKGAFYFFFFCILSYFGGNYLSRQIPKIYSSTIYHCLAKDKESKTEEDYVIDLINSLPPSQLFVWGNVSRLYFKTNRDNPLKPYYYHRPLFNKMLSEAQQSELRLKLERATPLVIVDAAYGHEKESLIVENGGSGEAESPALAVLRAWVKEHYVRVPFESDRFCIFVPRKWN